MSEKAEDFRGIFSVSKPHRETVLTIKQLHKLAKTPTKSLYKTRTADGTVCGVATYVCLP